MNALPNKSRRAVPVWVTLSAALVLLGLGQSAQAGLMTHDVNVTLNAGNIESYSLDVNLDGKTDFTFTAALVLDPILSVGFDQVEFPFGNNGVVIDKATSDGFPTASRLAVGDTVSAANTFSSSSDKGNLFFFTSFDPPSGNFGGHTGIWACASTGRVGSCTASLRLRSTT